MNTSLDADTAAAYRRLGITPLPSARLGTGFIVGFGLLLATTAAICTSAGILLGMAIRAGAC